MLGQFAAEIIGSKFCSKGFLDVCVYQDVFLSELAAFMVASFFYARF